jgi:hypothetical protein
MSLNLHFINNSNKWKLEGVWFAGPALRKIDGQAAQGAEMARAGPAGC